MLEVLHQIFGIGHGVDAIRRFNDPRQCPRCRGPFMLPGISCPGCGFNAGAYARRQASRMLKGAAAGLALGALGSWCAVGHVDGGAVASGAVLCGALASLVYSGPGKGPGPC